MAQTNRMQKWSKKIKENPIVEEEHKKKHADEMRKNRANWNKRQNERNREKSKIRMRKLRERQKLKINNPETLHRSIITRHEIKKQDEKRLKQNYTNVPGEKALQHRKSEEERCCTKKKKTSIKSKGRNKHRQGKSK